MIFKFSSSDYAELTEHSSVTDNFLHPRPSRSKICVTSKEKAAKKNLRHLRNLRHPRPNRSKICVTSKEKAAKKNLRHLRNLRDLKNNPRDLKTIRE